MQEVVDDDDIHSYLPAKAGAAAVAIEAWRRFPSQSDNHKKNRAILACKHILPLMQQCRWSRAEVLRWLTKKFYVPKGIKLDDKELTRLNRHIRRGEKILNINQDKQKGKQNQAPISDTNRRAVLDLVIAGKVSLETAEHMIINPSLGLIELAWLVTTTEQHQQFLNGLDGKVGK